MRSYFCDLRVVQNFDIINSKVDLKEDKRTVVTLTGIPADSVILKLDVDIKGYKKRSPYFNSFKDFIHKGCDYVIISKQLNSVYLIELKSINPVVKQYIEQFKASEFFLNYFFELYNYDNSVNLKLKYYKILFSSKDNVITTNVHFHSLDVADRNNKKIKVFKCGLPRYFDLRLIK